MTRPRVVAFRRPRLASGVRRGGGREGGEGGGGRSRGYMVAASCQSRRSGDDPSQGCGISSTPARLRREAGRGSERGRRRGAAITRVHGSGLVALGPEVATGEVVR